MSVDARKEDFEHIELFGKPALFSNSRIDRVTVPGNLYCYDLRGSDNDPGRPVTVENKVGVNHAGTVLAIEPVTIPEEGYKRLRGKINFLGEHIDIPSFCEEHGIEYLLDPRRFELRPASPDEAGLFYSQKEQDEALGTVGHMRFDHGHGGAEFWHTWWPHNGDDLNTPEFKKEFEAFVNEMREYGPLRNGRAMYDYCYPSDWSTNDKEQNVELADYNNERLGVTPEQRPAMEVGSMAGWDVPGADPANYGGHYTQMGGMTLE